jgi:hypothetical protein
MKRLLFLGAMSLLTACDSLQSSSKVTSPSPSASSSPTPTASMDIGPLSSGTPTPSPMTTGSPLASSNSEALPSGFYSPSPSPSSSVSTPRVTNNTPKSPTSGVSPNSNDSSINPDLQTQFYGLNNSNPTATKSSSAKTDQTPQTPAPTATQSVASTAQTITADGMGSVRLGMTIGELRKIKGYTFQTKSGFATGYNALAVSQKGKVQFYIPYARQKPLTDQDPVRFLVTENPAYKTERGVSPGMTLKQVSAVYGQPVLRLQKEAESGEILAFTQQPQSMAFSTGKSATKVGIYPKAQGKTVVQTTKYNEQAKIKRITVVCADAVCGAEQ